MKNNSRLSIGTITLLSIPAFLILLILPIPTLLLDILITINMLSVFAILIAVFKTRKPAYIPSLPTLLLLSTVFSMAVNISATRLILTNGVSFNGRLITAIGSLVSGFYGIFYLVVSCILFAAIIAVQLIVIIKNIVRVTKVSARFSLDALASKQMAIDAEYNTGAINENEAAFMKAVILKESDYYGAMNGTGKFISGNLKTILIIFVLTIAGGIAIGTLLKDVSFIEAVKTYIPLGIGSGLFIMLHAVLVSITMGTAITKIE